MRSRLREAGGRWARARPEDDVFRLIPGYEPLGLPAHERLDPRRESGGSPARVRRDERGLLPQRVVLWQRLGIGHVKHEREPVRVREKRLRVRHRAPRHIDEDGAVAHPREEGVVGHAARRIRKGDGENHDVGRRQQVRELGGGADRPASVGSSAAPAAAHLDLDRGEPAG